MTSRIFVWHFSIESFQNIKESHINRYNKKVELKSEPINDPNFVSVVHHIEHVAEFDDLVNKSGNKLIVVDLFANWCGPCRNVAPHVERLAKKYESQIVMVKVDVDSARDLASGVFRVHAMPTFVFLKGGKEVHRYSDDDSVTLEDTIKKYMN